MTYPRAFLDRSKMLMALAPAADAAGRNGGWVSVKGAARVTIVVLVAQGNAATVALTPQQATDITGTGAKALANPIPISANLDDAAAEAFVAQTQGVNFTTDAGVKNKVVVFDLDPAQLDINNGFDCIRINTGASNAANITAAFYILTGQRFPGNPARVN